MAHIDKKKTVRRTRSVPEYVKKLLAKEKDGLFSKIKSAFSIPFFQMVFNKMPTIGRTQMKVLWFIIQGVMVKMMNSLALFKQATYCFFHNQAVFAYITVFSGLGMIWLINIHISANDNFSTSPLWIIGTSSVVAILVAVLRIYAGKSIEFFSTIWANFYHLSLFNNHSIIIDLGDTNVQ